MREHRHALAARARDLMRGRSGRVPGSGVMRAEVRVPRLDALAWLRAQPGTPKFYWCDRDGALEIAGCGAADQVVSEDFRSLEGLFACLEERLEDGDDACRYFGGTRFSGAGVQEPIWQPFGAVRFVLPRFEIVNTPSESTFACNWSLAAGDAELFLSELDCPKPFPAEAPSDAFAVSGRFDLPDPSRWRGEVEATLRRLSRGDIQKLVLARKSVFQLARAVDPLVCLEALSGKADRCYRFCFMPDPEVAFLGLSPERLYRREGRRVMTEAIAGTRVRSADPLEDDSLARELAESGKEQREHAYVVRGIEEAVDPLCETLRLDRDVSVVKLEECQHLMSVFEGRLRADVGDVDLLGALHPTPAVGGYPTRPAILELAGLEPFDRGWYAGPIGWVAKTGAEFAVAIRSGLVRGSSVALFAGCGIVRGSIAEKEWQELDNKIRHFTRVLNLP